MTYRFRLILPLLITIVSVTVLNGQTITDKAFLAKMSKDLKDNRDNNYAKAKQLAKQKGWFIRKISPNGKVTALIGVDEMGNPKYVTTYNNTIAAATTRANQLWPGGSSGLNLSGSSNSVKGKIAIWDGGYPLSSHVELTGRILLKGPTAAVAGHPTHTTGTMIATGINPIAKGMAFGAQQLLAYDFNSDESEMAAAAPNLLVSNHSYGYLSGSGWDFDGTNYDWYGDTTISKSEAYGFGYYNSDAQIYDSIAYHAPNYLICVAAGNARGYGAPPLDSSYYYNGVTKLKFTSSTKINPNNPNYTSISNAADSKNTLVVGAVNGIPAGYNSPNDVSIAYFSSLGPTNDGRIKPDIVADGVNVTSTWNTSNTAYMTESGTSMATPNTTGSLYLLQEYYNKLHPTSFMRSATLKGLAIHTADEAGPAEGPDYTYGWGLLDVLKGANVITSSFNQQSDTIIESSLSNGTSSYTFNFIASGKGSLVATLSWTDPAGTPVAVAQSLNNAKAMLVNDLDMRITDGTQTYMPWILDPTNPANAATRGDNFRDNVEKINIDSAVVGQTYTITITYKGTLARGSQAFSLLVSGIGGQAYCTSSPTSSAGTRIDSVNISNINVANPPGCTTYTNNKNYIVQVQPKQKLPVRIKLSSCDASTADKIVKIFIDYNNDGVFDATTELAAQSGVINGNGIYSDTINIPELTTGNTTLMRIVAEETTNASDVQPCGVYGKGETQDYSVLVVSPIYDLALAQVIAPTSGTCSDTAELVVVGIRNVGVDTMSNVPITAVITDGGSTVATLNESYPGKIPPGFLVTYAFQKTFAAVAGTTYNITAYLTSANDQNTLNDTLSSSVAIATKPAAPSGTANVSGDTLLLKVNSPEPNTNYFWYNNATGDSSIAATTDTAITITSPTNTNFYLGSGAEGNIGVKSKNNYQGGAGGGYQTPGGNFLLYTAQVPVTLKSARMFIGNPGKVEMIVIDTFNTQPDGSYYYNVLSDIVIDVYATSPTPKVGSVAGINAADTGAVFYINLPLPAGKHLIWDSTIDASIDKSAIATASIFRNNNVTGDPYPFTIPNVISITGNSAASTSIPNQFQSYYYYLYNMKIQTNDCISDRTPIAVTGHINTTAGLNVWPNPSTNGQLTVSFNTSTTGNFQIELFDMLGRRSFSQNYSSTGFFTAQINTSNLITGMYILSVRQGNNLYKKKVLILR